jgi:hypothetical protein
MPHRIPLVTNTVSFFIELITLGLLTIWQGVETVGSIISEQDWNRITGPHGVAFIACAACMILWGSSVARDRKEDRRRRAEDEARERRHAETIKLQSDNAESLKALTVENAKTNMRVANAIHSLDQSIKTLVLQNETADR